jgi:hypothetical protein
MKEEINKTGIGENEKIDMSQPDEASYWTAELGVTSEKIIQAIRRVGPAVKDVKRYLQVI